MTCRYKEGIIWLKINQKIIFFINILKKNAKNKYLQKDPALPTLGYLLTIKMCF